MAGNITNPKTRRAYKLDVAEFSSFTGLTETVQLRTVARADMIAWRKDMFFSSTGASKAMHELFKCHT